MPTPSLTERDAALQFALYQASRAQGFFMAHSSLKESARKLKKSLADLEEPRPPAPPIHSVPEAQADDLRKALQSMPLRRSPPANARIRRGLEKGVFAGVLDPKLLGLADVDLSRALDLVPYNLRKSLDLPYPEEELTQNEVALRLQYAVAAGELDPRLLAIFDINCELALEQVPADVATRYGIPHTL
jgi:hypothetical protein